MESVRGEPGGDLERDFGQGHGVTGRGNGFALTESFRRGRNSSLWGWEALAQSSCGCPCVPGSAQGLLGGGLGHSEIVENGPAMAGGLELDYVFVVLSNPNHSLIL